MSNKKVVCRVMVGPPGCGKTFIANTFGLKVFSSDYYRFLLTGDENNQACTHEAFTRLYKDMREYLLSGKSCVFDATNMSMKDRAKIFNQLKGIPNLEIEAYVVNTSISVCIERDKQRNRTVGEDVIMKMVYRFQCPQYFEGFSSIKFRCNLQDSDINSSAALVQQSMLVMDQENPHHVHTLGNHCRRLASHYPVNSIEYKAGLWHDVGKLFTQTYDGQGIAHYYSHDNAGAYYLCSFPEWNYTMTTDEFLQLICFVNYHMNFHKDWRVDKYKKLFGETLYNKLIQFAEYDKEASSTEAIHQDIMKMQKELLMSLADIRNSEIWKTNATLEINRWEKLN